MTKLLVSSCLPKTLPLSNATKSFSSRMLQAAGGLAHIDLVLKNTPLAPASLALNHPRPSSVDLLDLIDISKRPDDRIQRNIMCTNSVRTLSAREKEEREHAPSLPPTRLLVVPVMSRLIQPFGNLPFH